MKWTTHGERTIYDSPWVRLTLVDIELPSGHRLDHHVVRAPADAAGTVVFDPERGVLLLWRHRFITDTWGWEIPAGRIDHDETPEQAARRETVEETGWRPGPLRPIFAYHPNNGQSDLVFHLFFADGAEHVGEPTDPDESDRIEWVSVARLRTELAAGAVLDGLSLTALLWFLAGFTDAVPTPSRNPD